ncbi:glutamate racemase [Hugenholtzia roseola]|uniref:glutamate racemase n=1 Tax=Hugenholtzia roseola TaxID=1002 RepID=UPI0004085052|nr:glutamate racemase [Hugenholtzia roseola]
MEMFFSSENRSAPIGVFDSGIGGMTVAKAISELLPQERLIYFGDTAHLPYGEKSTAALQAYVIKSIDFLLSHGCKVIVIACNSASAAAAELARAYTGSRAKVIDVITPMVEWVAKAFPNREVGLIGTRQTVHSQVYQRQIAQKQAGIALHALATPLLASLIEEGFFNDQVSKEVVKSYLSDPILAPIQALILACTHYPLIKNDIAAFFEKQGREVVLIDGSMIVAESLKAYLTEEALLSSEKTEADAFYVSDFTQSFQATTQIFFGKEVKLALFRLWE